MLTKGIRSAETGVRHGPGNAPKPQSQAEIACPSSWTHIVRNVLISRWPDGDETRSHATASATADATRKVLELRTLFPQNAHWYLAAWNVEKSEEHLYRLDRIVQVVLGTRVFGAHHEPPAERYARKQLYFQSGEEREVKVLFRNVASRIANERWPERAEAQPDGSVIVTTRMTPGPYLYGWVLGFGADAELVAPEDVRERFRAHVEELRRVYADVPA